jgi:peroxiredoxin
VSYTVGNDVGQRIPDFAIALVDGSTVTSEELLARRQPTFLFFFETW